MDAEVTLDTGPARWSNSGRNDGRTMTTKKDDWNPALGPKPSDADVDIEKIKEDVNRARVKRPCPNKTKCDNPDVGEAVICPKCGANTVALGGLATTAGFDASNLNPVVQPRENRTGLPIGYAREQDCERSRRRIRR